MSTATTIERLTTPGHEVQEATENFLRSRMPTAARNIECEYKEGMLLLRGEVTSYYAKQLAQEFARQVAGVDKVVNCLEVLRPTQVA